MEKVNVEKLIFIYNANSGAHNAVLDTAHKIFSPSTYECSLCDITFGIFTENKVWRKFRAQSTTPMEFLHKDEFLKTYSSKFGKKYTFPIVLAETNEDFEVVVTTEKMNSLDNVESLMREVLVTLN
ncbi:GTPase [Cellulophaga sp. E16_2]|uniref:GTPase n=1 Tax=Cellulophaga algicola (strain DSM 14237 / IC166 / ACAM 630) TaxID=688270 RepID=E6X5V6_CELAD|nr:MULTISPECIES: hypothetical protein [Cellulophaga]ADV49498.1 hypothetical protein Celal_2204 [Cellulophaga algicola DSM 14237]MBO0591951.1 GTPase [Cellulophaga sp. E16_2]